jgi:hypothetical protein
MYVDDFDIPEKNLLTPFRASCIASPAIGMAFLVYYLIPVRPPAHYHHHHPSVRFLPVPHWQYRHFERRTSSHVVRWVHLRMWA